MREGSSVGRAIDKISPLSASESAIQSLIVEFYVSLVQFQPFPPFYLKKGKNL